jgi:hypothetical protein
MNAYWYVRHLMQIVMWIESMQLLVVCTHVYVVLISCASLSRLCGLESDLVYLLRNVCLPMKRIHHVSSLQTRLHRHLRLRNWKLITYILIWTRHFQHNCRFRAVKCGFANIKLIVSDMEIYWYWYLQFHYENVMRNRYDIIYNLQCAQAESIE